MCKKELQRSIKKYGGYIFSDGTLNLEHLLAKSYDMIIAWNLRANPNSHIKKVGLRHDIREAFEIEGGINEVDEYGLFHKVYYGEAKLKANYSSDVYYLWEDCVDYFMSIAPKGYYFGSNEGDGALIGWFELEEQAW